MRIQVAGPVGQGASARTPNPQLVLALLLVDDVRRRLQALLPQALAADGVSVSETEVRRWQAALQDASRLVESIPTILIFPPPVTATLNNAALALMSQALATLASINFVSPAIFPPVPGQAVLLADVVQSLLTNVRQAEAALLLSLRAA